MHEVNTQKLVMQHLSETEGIEEVRAVAKTGVVAVVRGTAAGGPEGKAKGRVVLLRADMDALPMQDLKEGCEYRSTVDNVCHSCGHDVHVAVGLGAGKLIAAHRHRFAGTALLVFQPAEETSIGARAILASGLIGKFKRVKTEAEEKALDEALADLAEADEDGAHSGDDEDNDDGDFGDEEWTVLPDTVGDLPQSKHLPGATHIQRRHGWVYGRVLRPTITAALSFHVETARSAGYVAVREGPMYASCDDVKVVIHGRGGHAGCPHLAINPLFVGAQLVSNVNAWLSRSVSHLTPCVLTFCRFESGTTSNVIPETCVIEGTLRTHNAQLREELVERLPLEMRLIAASFDASAEVTIRRSFAPGSNTSSVVAAVRSTATSMLGSDHCFEIDYPVMGSEDFFEFGCQGRVPSAMFWLGGANEAKGITVDNHNGHFDVDEDCLAIGAAVMAGSAIRILAKGLRGNTDNDKIV